MSNSMSICLLLLSSIVLRLGLFAPIHIASSFSVVGLRRSSRSKLKDCCHLKRGARQQIRWESSPLADAEDWSPLQLWLDLRGTAITPSMALSKLDQDSPFQVNKVIVALADAERASQFREPGDPEMLVVDEVDNSLCNAEDPSIQYGTVVTLTGDSFVDPIPALETASSGGWVYVDSEHGAEEDKERSEAVSNLVNFISGGLSLGKDSFSFDLEAKESPNANTEKGGIAVACQTKADLLHAANLLRSIDSGTVITTESGILLKADPVEGTSSRAESLQSALVLPFDTPLWKAAALVVAEAPP